MKTRDRTPSFHQRFSSLTLALLMGLGASAVAAPPPWADAPYTYFAERKVLADVLRDFAASFSLSASLPEGLNQRVNGRFTAKSPSEFLDRIAGIYGLNWYTYAGVLHVSRIQDTVVKAISVPSVGGSSSVRQVLTELQVFEPRFGWSEIPEQGIAIVSGPKSYAETIEKTIAALPKAPGGQQVVMYRLRYASVDDRTINYRDREITVPGVATVLRNLMQINVPGIVRAGPPGGAGGGAQQAGNYGSGTGSTGVGLSLGNPAPLGAMGPGGAAPSGNSQPGAATAGGSAGPGGAGAQGGSGLVSTQNRPRANIQSDPRLNAIIVQDAPDRIPLYTSLIAQMDIPAPLIEIEALIVDVNTTRLQELGIAWGARGSGGTVAAGYGTVNTTPDAKTISIIGGSAGSAAQPTTAVLDNAGRYLVARLRALEEQGDASIQARPSILTVENIGAVIDLSETVYIQTTSERTALVTPVTAGTTLRVTPRLSNRGDNQSVFLTVDIEDGQVQQGSAGTNNLPSIRKGVVSTEASLGTEESLLIGGYNSVQTVVGTSKVPVLGDIPGIGALFSSRSNSVQRRERLFLLKTRVVARVQEVQASSSSPPSPTVVPAASPVVLLGAPASDLGLSSVTVAATQPIAGSDVQTSTLTPWNDPPSKAASTATSREAPVAASNNESAQPPRELVARKALQNELETEQRALQQLRREAQRNGESNELRRRISRKQTSIQAIKKELAKLSAVDPSVRTASSR